MPKATAILIAGPTASGLVVNADSMQVYRDLRVITARPTREEEARVPHRLYGHVDAAENYSVGRWCRDVAGVLAEAAALKPAPILVGGTGLYFKALTMGLAAVPPIPNDVRARVRGRIDSEGVRSLYDELIARDPQTANRIMPNDRSRISRALEVIEATGRSLSDWHREGLPPLVDAAKAAKVFITCERGELVRRIETRFAAMLKAGALEEVRALSRRHLDPSLPAMKAHGVPWLIRHLRGELTLEQATAGAVMDTRRYAKRQLTWFRNQMKDWPWVTAESAQQAIETQAAAQKSSLCVAKCA